MKENINRKYIPLPQGLIIAIGLVWLFISNSADPICELSWRGKLYFIVLGLILLWILYMSFIKKKRSYFRFIFVIGVFIIVGCIRAISLARFDLLREISFQQLYYLIIAAILTYWLTIQIVDSPKFLTQFAKAFLIVGVLVAVLGILEIVFRKNILYENHFHIYNELYINRTPIRLLNADFTVTKFYGRVFSSIGHPAYLSQYLLFPLFIGFYFLISAKNLKQKILSFASVNLIGFCLILTMTRSSWFGAFIGVIGLVLSYWRRRFLKYLLLIIPALIIAFAMPSIRRRIYSRLFEQVGSHIPAFAHRSRKLKSVLTVLKKRPITGLGFGMYYYQYKKYLERDQYFDDPTLDIVDNQYLELTAETGIVGGVLLVTWVILTLFFLGRLAFQKKDPMLFSLFWGLIAFSTSIAILGSFIPWIAILTSFATYLSLVQIRARLLKEEIIQEG